MPRFIKCLSAIFLISLSLLAPQALASYLDSKTYNNVVYSLFSAPNKILRYDMIGEASLSDINLSKTPTAFTVANDTIYIAFGRELRAINLSSNTDVFIKNTSSDTQQIVSLGTNLFIVDLNGNITAISAADYHTIDTKYAGYSYSYLFAVSELYSSIYLQSSSSYITKYNVGSDGKMSEPISAPSSPASQGNKLFINKSQNKLYNNAGSIQFTDSLAPAGSLNQNIDSIAFINDNPIVISDNQLKVFTAFNTLKGEITLASKPVFSASYGQKVFTFALSDTGLSATVNDLSSFKLPLLGQAPSALDSLFVPEFYEADEEGNIYLIDKQTLSIFRWSIAQNAYLESWPLTRAPTSATYSAAHKRLYLGYNDGKITYISPAETAAKEHPFAALSSGIYSLVSAGQFLFAADQNYWHQESMLDSNGNTLSTNNQYNTSGDQYHWNAANNRIYRSGSNSYISWSEVDPATGIFTLNNSTTYSSTGDIFIANKGSEDLLIGTGQILDPISFSPINSLSNSVSDGSWANGNLITIGKAPLSLQYWGVNYEQLASFPLRTAIAARLIKANDKLVLIQQQNSGLNFTWLNPNQFPDADLDGIHDFKDNCISIVNGDQIDTDGDGQGNNCDVDDDNDGISDNIETAFGLNPLNANDQQEDLDKDGFSNIVEIVSGSSIADVNSVPNTITNYSESFENGWPAVLYSSTDRRPWSIQTPAATGAYSLVSSNFLNNKSASELNFSAFFNSGQFSVKYKILNNTGYSTQYNISILVDGVSKATQWIYSYDNEWQTINLNISRGVHKISIRLSKDYDSEVETTDQLAIDDIKFQSNPNNQDTDGDGIGWDFDNCPNTVNPTQSDIDLDGTGDACDTIDNRPRDTDVDGLDDSIDNCPSLANPVQQNMDNDSTGDVCDTDIDGDGVANAVEKTFSFMNERNPEDAQKDQDGDGVSNGYEIASSTNPAVADVFPSISLFDYFPLGEINSSYKYFTGYDFLYFTNSMKKLSTPNTYNITSSYYYAETPNIIESSYQIERRNTGIYLTQNSYFDTYNDFTNHLILPGTMKLGGSITNESKSTSHEAGNTNIENITTKFELIRTGQSQWKGVSYPSITIKRTVSGIHLLTNYTYKDAQEITYLKGLGQVSGENITYEKIEIISLDNPPAQPQPESIKKKSGGGAADIWLLIGLALFSLVGFREKRFANAPTAMA